MDKKKIQCSLICATYNWPEALSLCLQSILAQTVLPHEIIIADDGSSDKTKAVIDAFKKQTNIPVKHIWHKDDGFRKTIILNEAVRLCTADYIIETDGDIILHPQFIEDHLEAMEPNAFIRGSRALITKAVTENLLAGKLKEVNFFSPGIQNRLNVLRSPFISKVHHTATKNSKSYGMMGCNFSFWKKDFIDVNGYNNDIMGWGHEDTELAARLFHNGVTKRMLKFKAVCFHLYHTFNERDKEDDNMDLCKLTIKKKLRVCKNGYNNQHPITVW